MGSETSWRTVSMKIQRGGALMTAPWQRSWLKSGNNPLIFVRDVLGATPEPWQAAALEAVRRHDRVSIWPRRGEDDVESWLILWFLLTHHCKIPVVRRTLRTSSETRSGLRSPSGTVGCLRHSRP